MCDHMEFTARVEVNRLEDTQDGESLQCAVDLRIPQISLAKFGQLAG